MKVQTIIYLFSLMGIVGQGIQAQPVDGLHMANGIKIGEVSSSSAIVWTRLTQHPERNLTGKPFPNVKKLAEQPAFGDLSKC